MDDPTAASHVGAASPPQAVSGADLEGRFRALVQSPLRAGLLRFLTGRSEHSFDIDSLTRTFGRLPVDVENCVRELVDFGVARALPDNPPRYAALRPGHEALALLLERFLERRPAAS